MPELPEVEVVRRGIDAHLVGARLDVVSVLDARSVRRHASGALGFERDLAGRRVLGTGRRGKFMWLELGGADGTGGGPDALMVHLGMSGQVRVHRNDAAGEAGSEAAGEREVEAEGPASDPIKHLRIRLDARRDDGTPVRADFIDQRIFGGMWVSPLGGEVPADAQHIARDVLDPHFDRRQVARRVTASRAAIKRLLLDQGVVSGIGNIYADEALWAARVHGETPGDALSARAVYRVLDEAAAVMRRALDQGGTSFDALYVNVDGRQGYFARSLAAYGKTGEPCPRCGTPIQRIMSGGRSSHFCPRCQRRR
ncbi:bifunctional DNA-formamidopyrimidine glycosylase/DNA-(apurinic or apyrimidinic site) lyase [Micrococcales bacterium 31B]|nr:bifunctional DNA-formamidopyrimidine glycosylase/DNA-(apurinic or apyrimidinic site) lyase [Micrococcales bacterium 31B]